MQRTPDSESDFVAWQLLELVASQSRRVLWSVMGATLLLLAICHEPGQQKWELSWAIWVLLTQLVRARVQTRLPDRNPVGEIQRGIRRGIYVAALAGSSLGLVLWSFPTLGDTERGLLTLLLLGMVTGAVSNSAGHTATYWAFSLPLVLPLGLCWSLLPGQNYSRTVGLGFGAVILLGYAAMLSNYAAWAWRIFDQSCRIRFRESELNQALTQALAAAEKASLAKTRFLAAASHDLRQPLHTISFLGAALSLRELDTESKDMVVLLNKVTTSLSSQLDSLLDISKLDAGVVVVDRQAISLAGLLQRFYSGFAHLANAKGLQSQLQLDSRGDAIVLTDPALLQRVVMNVCQNALKFTDQGHIIVRMQLLAHEVEVSVTDTGCGIATEMQGDVFQEFFQATNPQRNADNGLGLGLSIVQRLCHLLGIRMQLQSELHVGTTFLLAMPRLQQSGISAADLQPPTPSETTERFELAVLVIDDEASVRQACAYLLRELGCSVYLAEDLPSALAQCAMRHPDLVIADLRLRHPLNGIETIQALRAHLGPLPALLVSGDTAPERLRLARDAQLRMCHKPLTLSKLTEELRFLVRQENR